MAAKVPPATSPGSSAAGTGQYDLFARSRPRAEDCAPRILTVSELNREVKGLLEPRFLKVAVSGEVSNYRPAASGHHYFTLKDAGSCIAAVLFRADAARLKLALRDGLAVIARGRLALYEARGQYQIICDGIEPSGAGALALAFEQLKAKLGQEGLFEPARKRPLPFLARRIGVVTSTSGAALADFLRVLHDRFPIPVLIAPARVQGEGAAGEIAAGIARLARAGVEVIVVTRGGGSIEDLWAFNEEIVARAIAGSPVPVVSAVGHEVDFTIADFVADRRCATPTDAAKTLAPSRDDLVRSLEQRFRHVTQAVLRIIAHQRERLRSRAGRLADPRRRIATERLALDHIADRMQASVTAGIAGRRRQLAMLGERLQRGHPRTRLGRAVLAVSALRESLVQIQRSRHSRERERLAALSKRLAAASPARSFSSRQRSIAHLRESVGKAMGRRIHAERLRLSRAAAGLDSLSPLAVLGRGYAIAFRADGRILTAAVEAPSGSRLRLLLSDRSQLEAQVVSPVSEETVKE